MTIRAHEARNGIVRNNVANVFPGQAALEGRFGHMLLRFEDMLERQAFLGFAVTEPDLELGLFAAQAIEPYDLCESGLHLALAFGADILAQMSDLQSLLKVPCPWLTEVVEYTKIHPDADDWITSDSDE